MAFFESAQENKSIFVMLHCSWSGLIEFFFVHGDCGMFFCGQLTVWTTSFFFLSEICYVQNDIHLLVEFREDFMEVKG